MTLKSTLCFILGFVIMFAFGVAFASYGYIGTDGNCHPRSIRYYTNVTSMNYFYTPTFDMTVKFPIAGTTTSQSLQYVDLIEVCGLTWTGLKWVNNYEGCSLLYVNRDDRSLGPLQAFLASIGYPSVVPGAINVAQAVYPPDLATWGPANCNLPLDCTQAEADLAIQCGSVDNYTIDETTCEGACNDTCWNEKAALVASCGALSNVEMDVATCQGQCICTASGGSIGDLYQGDWSPALNQIVCLSKSDSSGNACKHLINSVEVDPWFEEHTGEPYSYVEMVRYAETCSPASTDLVPAPVEPPKDCLQSEADCMITCGSPQLVETFDCDPDTGDFQCDCIPMSNCDQLNTACAQQCGGAENISETYICEMVAGIPTATSPCECIAPPDDITCDDYRATCVTQCGTAENIKSFECADRSWGPQITTPCSCRVDGPTCPEGEICDGDGACQPGESETSADCIKDTDKDGCPDGQICEGDQVCQPGESKDSYDCGGNNDGNTGNDPGGDGSETGNSTSEPCPQGQVCSGDGVCQPGEAETAVDCAGPGEEGEAGEIGSSSGLCPEGQVCSGDGVCQPGEAPTSVDCVAADYTSFRIGQMKAKILSSDLMKPLTAFNVPGGGSSVSTLNMGSIGGVKTFDWSQFEYAWLIIAGVLLTLTSWAGVKIITLKQG